MGSVQILPLCKITLIKIFLGIDFFPINEFQCAYAVCYTFEQPSKTMKKKAVKVVRYCEMDWLIQ